MELMTLLDKLKLDHLEAQLDAVSRSFLKERGKNYFDKKAKRIEISPIFKWFSKDFEKEGGSLRGFLAKHVDKELRDLVRDETVDIAYSDYDWALNGIENKP